MSGIVEWLLAQIEADETIAKAAKDSPGPWEWFTASFGPEWVLAECAAKREVIGRHTERLPAGSGLCEWCSDQYVAGEVREWPCPDVGNLLTVYADRDGYDPEWAKP